MTVKEIISQLKKNSNPKDKEGMARFGINSKTARWMAGDALKELTVRK